MTKRAPSKKAPARMKINADLLAQAKAQVTRHPIERVFPATKIFEPYQPMPGVIPKQSLKIAMDECAPQWGWAQSGINDLIQEGMAFLGYPLLAEMAQRPEYRRLSEIIASECTREWIEFKGKGDEESGDAEEGETEQKVEDKIKELEDELDRLDLRGAVREALMLDGLFGRGHIYIDTGTTDDPDELKTPLSNSKGELTKAKIKLGSVRALKPVEPAWTYPTSYNSSDPLADNWYNPDGWYVMGKQLHTSRLATFIGRKVPDMLKPAYSFGGLSLTQMAKPYVDNWLRTRQSVSDILQAFSVMVLMTNLQTTLQGGADTSLLMRADLFNALRDNRGLMMVDKTSEDFKNVSAPLGTLDHLQAQSQEHICSVSGIPLVKYTGISPTGLNASSEGELRVFYDWVHAYQETFRDPVSWIVDAVQISLWGRVDPNIIFTFKPLWALDEKTEADLEKVKADTDAVYIDLGVISPEESRKRVATDAKSPYQGLDPADLPEPPAEQSQLDLGGGPSAESEEGGAKPPAEPKTPGAVSSSPVSQPRGAKAE